MLAQPMKLRITTINAYTCVELNFGGNVERSEMIRYSPGTDMINSHNRMITLSSIPPR